MEINPLWVSPSADCIVNSWCLLSAGGTSLRYPLKGSCPDASAAFLARRPPFVPPRASASGFRTRDKLLA